MIRTRECVKIKMLVGKPKQLVESDEIITCIDGLGIRQIHGNKFYSITVARGEKQGTTIGESPTFYDAADFVRTLMQNTPNFNELVEKEKWRTVVDALRTTQFMLLVHFGTRVNLRCGNFNS